MMNILEYLFGKSTPKPIVYTNHIGYVKYPWIQHETDGGKSFDTPVQLYEQVDSLGNIIKRFAVYTPSVYENRSAAPSLYKVKMESHSEYSRIVLPWINQVYSTKQLESQSNVVIFRKTVKENPVAKKEGNVVFLKDKQ